MFTKSTSPYLGCAIVRGSILTNERSRVITQECPVYQQSKFKIKQIPGSKRGERKYKWKGKEKRKNREKDERKVLIEKKMLAMWKAMK